MELHTLLHPAAIVLISLRYLRNLTKAPPASLRSRFSLSPTPDPNDPVLREEDRLDNLHWEHKAYHDLIQDGGHPSHRPDDSGSEYLNEPQNRTDIISYWTTICHGVESILQHQRWHWEEFRKHQDWRRWRYWKPEWFERFVQEVREYRRKKGLEGDIYLLQDRKEQSRLEDWVEFQYWEYKKADRLVKERERYAEGVKRQEVRLQEAIDAGQSVEKIEMIREHSLALMEGGRGGAEISLERQNILLKWIDEQLPIIASECQTSVISTHLPNDCQSTSIGTSLGKRKRSIDQTGHVKDSRRRVEFAEPCDTESPPVKHADVRSSKPADIPESEAPRMPNTRRWRHRNAHMEACADGDTIHTLNISSLAHRKPSPKRTNPSERVRTRVKPVQTQSERRSVRAVSNSSGLRQQPAATPAKAELATSAISSKRRSSTAQAPQSTILGRVHSSRISKTRGQARTQVSPEAAHRDDARQSPRQGKQKSKPATVRDGKNSAKGGSRKQHLANAPVRRSPRLEAMPAIYYSR